MEAIRYGEGQKSSRLNQVVDNAWTGNILPPYWKKGHSPETMDISKVMAIGKWKGRAGACLLYCFLFIG